MKWELIASIACSIGVLGRPVGQGEGRIGCRHYASFFKMNGNALACLLANQKRASVEFRVRESSVAVARSSTLCAIRRLPLAASQPVCTDPGI
jgi:hypothetical protein